MPNELPPRARRLLIELAAIEARPDRHHRSPRLPESPDHAADLAALLAADLVARRDGALTVTAAGRAHLARLAATAGGAVEPFRAQHLAPEAATVERPEGPARVTVDAGESPLAWLARRKGRDGRPLIAPEQFLAGERLRAEFTRAQMTPRVTANWDVAAPADRSARGAGAWTPADGVIAARQRLRQALDAAGPEFSGLLVDVCCFLKGLEDVERERQWPPRSAKVVLQLGLDRLARHYGLGREARGRARAPVVAFHAEAE